MTSQLTKRGPFSPTPARPSESASGATDRPNDVRRVMAVTESRDLHR